MFEVNCKQNCTSYSQASSTKKKSSDCLLIPSKASKLRVLCSPVVSTERTSRQLSVTATSFGIASTRCHWSSHSFNRGSLSAHLTRWWQLSGRLSALIMKARTTWTLHVFHQTDLMFMRQPPNIFTRTTLTPSLITCQGTPH